jgi:hypothetical protein
MSLWTEWEFGIGGRKPAKDWTREERGHPKSKQMYHRRRNIWRVQDYLIRKGHNIQSANDLILQTYGMGTSLTKISERIVKDKSTYEASGGLHPNLRRELGRRLLNV